MKKLILTILLIGGLQAMAQTNAPLSQELTHAEYLVNNSRNSQAFSEISSILSQQPNCHRAYYIRSKAHHNDGNYKAALQDINTALKYQSQNAAYLMQKCAIMLATEKPDQAAECISRAMKIDSSAVLGSSEGIFLASDAMVASRNTLEALRILNMTELRNAQFYRLRGMALCQSEMYEYAINDLNQALDLDPSLSDVYVWRGLAKYKSGKTTEARSDWETAVRKHQRRANEYLQKYR